MIIEFSRRKGSKNKLEKIKKLIKKSKSLRSYANTGLSVAKEIRYWLK